MIEDSKTQWEEVIEGEQAEDKESEKVTDDVGTDGTTVVGMVDSREELEEVMKKELKRFKILVL